MLVPHIHFSGPAAHLLVPTVYAVLAITGTVLTLAAAAKVIEVMSMDPADDVAGTFVGHRHVRRLSVVPPSTVSSAVAGMYLEETTSSVLLVATSSNGSFSTLSTVDGAISATITNRSRRVHAH